MRAAGINRQLMANIGDRLAGRPLEPRRPPEECRLGAQLPDGCHVTRAPSGSSLAHARCSAARAGCCPDCAPSATRAGRADDGRSAVAASAVPAVSDPVRSSSLAPGAGVGPLHDATSRRGLPSRAAPEGFSCAHARIAASRLGCARAPDDGRAAVAASADAAELTVPVSDGVLLMLRLAASAAGISLGEAVGRAICRYADSLGLQVLADAMALDPDLAVDFAHPRSGASRFKGGP
jgi:hypothetical protein